MAQLDVRPGPVHLTYRSGTEVTVAITWPAGSLAGRTFTSTLAGVALGLSIVGDVMTVTVTDAQTVAAPATAEWLLTETSAGSSDDVLAGTWTKSTRPAARSSFTVNVTQGAATVTVDVSGQGSLDAHRNLRHRNNVRIPPGWGDNAWFTGRSLAASQVVGIDMWSDSIGSDGAGVSPSSSQATLGVAGLLETALQAAYGDGGSGYRSGATAYAAQTGTWTAEIGFGGVGYRATAAASIEWTGLRGSSIRFFHRNSGITGQFRYQVDGGSFTTVTTPAAFGLDPASVDVSGLNPAVTHTFRVEWVSGTFVAHGVYAAKATGVNLRRFGVSGRAASDYGYNSLGRFQVNTTSGSPTITCASPGWFDSNLLRAAPGERYLAGTGIPASAKITAVGSATSLTINQNATANGTNVDVDVCVKDTLGLGIPGLTTQFEPFLNAAGCGRPHLLIVMLGANDPAAADITARGFRDGYSRILKPYFSSSASALTPSLVVCQEHQGNWFDIYGRWPEMTSVMDAIAAGNGGAYVDHWGIGRRSHQYGEDQGWFADAIHPSNTGHQVLYAQPIIDLLTIGA